MSGIVAELLNLIFPEQKCCLICNRRSGYEPLCKFCEKALNLLNKQEFCHRCGKFIEVDSADQLRICNDCLQSKHLFQMARAFGPYKDILKELIYLFKYQGKQSLGKVLGDLMIGVFYGDKRYNDIDLIVPVPITARKLSERRFNQSRLLAERIAEITRINIDSENLIKVFDTASQSKLTKQGRQVNLKGAFLLKKPSRWEGSKILLVDDIFTTGSTVNECCRVLLQAGVKSIKVITLAAGSDDRKG